VKEFGRERKEMGRKSRGRDGRGEAGVKAKLKRESHALQFCQLESSVFAFNETTS